jgi:hypothetical protein
MGTDAGRHRFLSDISMASPVDQASGMTAGQLFLGQTDDKHGPVEDQKALAADAGRHRVTPPVWVFLIHFREMCC